MSRLLAICLFLSVSMSCNNVYPAEAVPDTTIQDSTSTKTAVADSTAVKAKKEKKEFEEVVKDFERIEGLFTFYRKDDEGKVYIEVKPNQFERIYLCGITRESGDGFYFDSAAMTLNFTTMGSPSY